MTRPPALLLCSDSFKGTLSSARVAELLTQAAQAQFPGCTCLRLSVADGGEGTVEALVEALSGCRVSVEVTGPLGSPVQASFGLVHPAESAQGALPAQDAPAASSPLEAVIEMAAASGLPLVEGEKNVLAATTYGTGQLILAALDAGATSITLAVGGSATNDGGMGLLSALGAAFADKDGALLPGCGASLEQVETVDLSGLDPRLWQVDIKVLCDVDNPLLGPEGCARVFSPQKGATLAQVEDLERGMAHYAAKLEEATGRRVQGLPGAGAAGGLAFGCMAGLGAQLVSGIDQVLALIGFEGLAAQADLVVTGEGHLDAQTSHGKVCAGIGAVCQRLQVPCVAIVGGAAIEAPAIAGIDAVVPCVGDVMSLDEALAQSERTFTQAAKRLFGLVALGGRLQLRLDKEV